MSKESIESQSESEKVETIPLVTPGIPGMAPEPLPVPVEDTSATGQLRIERRHIVKSATLVMLGNLGSSVMGMVRQIVVASVGSAISGPFLSALLPAQTFYDFLVNGSVSGALIPTFTDYAEPEKHLELRRLVFTIVNLVIIVTLIAALLFLFFAPWFVNTVLVPGYTTSGKLLTLQYARIVFFSLVALGPFAVLLAALYALKEFGWPAFATASYHVGIIIGAIIGGLVGEHFYGY